MKQIIEEVLQAEDHANACLKQAREKAATLKATASQQSLEQIAQAKLQAQQLLQSAVEQARCRAEQTRTKKLTDANRQNKAFLANSADDAAQLVDAICHLIIATDPDKDADQ